MSDVPRWFAQQMVQLAEAYPSMRLREGMVRMYYAILCDLPEDVVMEAFRRAPREHPSFFPAAGELRVLMEATGSDIGLLAWSGLHNAASTVGAYGSLTCADCAVAEALLAVFGSWPEFCSQCPDASTSAWMAKRQEFLAAYRDARRRRLPGAMSQRLHGWCEMESGYEQRAAVWSGQLSLSGDVAVSRDRPQLPPSAAPRALTGAAE